MTGVEAVSNGVKAFREPSDENARKTLTTVIALLIVLLAGIAWLVNIYQIGATDPGQPGYQSILSMLVAAILGRAFFTTSPSGLSCWCWRSRRTPRLRISRACAG